MAAPRLTCLFHSSVTVTSFLASPAGRALGGDLLVECSLRPSLSYVLNLETPPNYPGVAGLLGGVDLGTLAHPTERLPAPILLAPGTEVAPNAFRASLGLLRRPDERLQQVTLLVPFGEAGLLGAALAACDRFAIAWDVAETPHAELGEFGRWLEAEALFDATNFGGLLGYTSEPIEPGHTQRMKALLAPLAAPGAPVTLPLTAS